MEYKFNGKTYNLTATSAGTNDTGGTYYPNTGPYQWTPYQYPTTNPNVYPTPSGSGVPTTIRFPTPPVKRCAEHDEDFACDDDYMEHLQYSHPEAWTNLLLAARIEELMELLRG